MNIVPATVTQLTAAEAAGHLVAALPRLSRDAALLVLALCWVETGRGKAIQWNPGMVTAAENYQGYAWRPPWYEDRGDLTPRMRTLHELMLKGKAPKAFRAYQSASEGFKDWAAVLTKRYQNVLQAASTGDPSRFVAELKKGYSADYGPAHVKTFAHLQRELAPTIDALNLPGTGLVPYQAPPTAQPSATPLLAFIAAKALGIL